MSRQGRTSGPSPPSLGSGSRSSLMCLRERKRRCAASWLICRMLLSDSDDTSLGAHRARGAEREPVLIPGPSTPAQHSPRARHRTRRRALTFNSENQLATQRRICQHLLARVYFHVGFIEINTVSKCLCHNIFEYLSGIYCSMYFIGFKKDEKSKSSTQGPHEKRLSEGE